ncbi:hypothetical protein GOZ90_11120 [Agrobacterium vitis]|uniref:Uncharacterized protein n=1 Tax=Agrobacterium vitis TaxID=373 RepID=A0A6L6VEA3_AGRVI|nr:hypothetical protein [Agrobacterium vitis]MUZ73235.1 hypothetical protein [Agrobacterium vitis]MVA55359.1 hypothetical protein [Agrobacterium vitis]
MRLPEGLYETFSVCLFYGADGGTSHCANAATATRSRSCATGSGRNAAAAILCRTAATARYASAGLPGSQAIATWRAL